MTPVGRKKVSQLMDGLRGRIDHEQVCTERPDCALNRGNVVDRRRSQAGGPTRAPGHDRRLGRQHHPGPFRPLGDPVGRGSMIVSQVVPRLPSLQNRSFQRGRHTRSSLDCHSPLASGSAVVSHPSNFDSPSADRVVGHGGNDRPGKQLDFASVSPQVLDVSCQQQSFRKYVSLVRHLPIRPERFQDGLDGGGDLGEGGRGGHRSGSPSTLQRPGVSRPRSPCK